MYIIAHMTPNGDLRFICTLLTFSFVIDTLALIQSVVGRHLLWQYFQLR